MITTFQTRLTKKTQLAENTFIFGFQITSSEPLVFQAGQYVILLVPTGQSFPARRLYSVLSSPDNHQYFEILVEYIPNGIGSEYLKKITEKDLITFQGPAGVFTLRDVGQSTTACFIATGTGIAPVYCMIRQLLTKSEGSAKKIELFFGLKNYKDRYLFQELKDLATKYPQFLLRFCLSRETDLNNIPAEERLYFSLGRVTVQTDAFSTEDFIARQFYICGGKETVESIREYLASKNVPKNQVFFERFT